MTHKAPVTPHSPCRGKATPPPPPLSWRLAGRPGGGSGAGPWVPPPSITVSNPRILVTGSGPGLYALPSTVGYINHDCTRVAGPAYSLFQRPIEGKAGGGGRDVGGGPPISHWSTTYLLRSRPSLIRQEAGRVHRSHPYCVTSEAAVPLWSVSLWKGSSGRCSPSCLTQESCVSVSRAVSNEGTVLTKL